MGHFDGTHIPHPPKPRRPNPHRRTLRIHPHQRIPKRHATHPLPRTWLTAQPLPKAPSNILPHKSLNFAQTRWTCHINLRHIPPNHIQTHQIQALRLNQRTHLLTQPILPLSQRLNHPHAPPQPNSPETHPQLANVPTHTPQAPHQ